MKPEDLLRFLQKVVNKHITKAMKKNFLIFLFSLICSGIYAQEKVCGGKIVYVPEFYIQGEIGEGAPCAVFGIKTDSIVYVLTNDSVPLFGNGNFEAAAQICSIGDSVEISGYIHTLIDDNTLIFPALEIESLNILASFSSEKIPGTYTGTLVSIPNPAMEIPAMPGLVVGLKCDDNQYVLSKKEWLGDNYVEMGEVCCEVGDSVEIKGEVSTHIDLLNRIYFELEIDTIRKNEKDVDSTGNGPLHEIGEVRYDASSHNIVIECDVSPNTIEVFDAQGRCVLRVTGPGQSVSVARLPHGLYVYRLWGNGIICSGKFVR